MTDGAGYRLQLLGDDGVLALYRGTAPGVPSVLVLAPSGDPADPAALARMENEYVLRDDLDPAWAACPRALVRDRGRPLLLLDDPGGEPLERRLAGRPLGIGEGLRVALGIAEALDGLHGRGLIHKDLQPAHLLVDSDGAVRFTGFGIASRLPREHLPPAPPELLPGALPYLAPEQTGRMNRSLDSRADLYALGVVAYSLLTGAFPFTAADPMEWVHCHIARRPVPPSQRGADIPAVLSGLVLKLLAKTAEERYQTAAGVAADLRRCLAAWAAEGSIPAFPLGEADGIGHLLIPEKLYGREAEVAALETALARVAAGGQAEFMLVSGYAGVGKSSVVHELHRALVASRGSFIAAKFDQFRRDIPYATLARALGARVEEILTRDEAETNAWRTAIAAAVAPHGRVVTDLIPELAHLLGPQPALAEVPPREAESRCHAAFCRFLAALAGPGRPLVLFLDDLQWIDTASLKVVEELYAGTGARHLLVVGACRDNEVGPGHPLRFALSGIRAAGARVGEMVLKPLGRHDLEGLVADALRLPRLRAAPLARLVFEKTGGNPYFAIQFLAALEEEGLLAAGPASGDWHWDAEAIAAKGYSDSVADLLAEKLERLPPDTREALSTLACLGNRADLATLALARGEAPEAVSARLWEALRAGLARGQAEAGYAFSHDRVEEAAYALIPAEERGGCHLAIARRLAAGWPAAIRNERVFELADHYHRGVAGLTDPQERDRVAALQRQAGRRARAAAAHGAAREYFARAVALLPVDAWMARRADTFDLHLDLVQCEYLGGSLEAAAALADRLMGLAASDFDRARVCRLRVQMAILASRFDAAVGALLEALALFGIALPAGDDALPAALAARRQAIAAALAGRDLADLLDAPACDDPAVGLLIGLIAEAAPATYGARPRLFPLLAAVGVELSLRHGNAVASATSYGDWSIVLLAGDDIAAGCDYSELSLALADWGGNLRERSAAWFRHGFFANHRRHPLAGNLHYLNESLRLAQEAGDRVATSFPRAGRIGIALECGLPIAEALARYGADDDGCDPATRGLIRIWRQYAAALLGRTRGPASFDDEGFDSAACLEAMVQANWGPGIGSFHTLRLALAVFDRQPDGDLVAAAEAARPGMAASAFEQLNLFYQALALTALLPGAGRDQQAVWRTRLEELAKRFRSWASHCPENFGHWQALLAAELARLDGRELEAETGYEAAIRAAGGNGFPHHAALAAERAAAFHASRGLPTVATAYLSEAHAAYRRWGALGKVAQLESEHPGLRPASAAGRLDLETVVRASQALSGEIVLDRLIRILMTLALEQAGADRGLLILGGGAPRIRAEAVVGEGGIDVVPASDPVDPDRLPGSVCHYVARSRTPLRLDDAATSAIYGDDPYVRRHRPRSLLCLPLLKQGEAVGALYLENRLAPGAFTPQRLELLRLLASQAAISLANAGLYADLARENADRQRAEQALRESQGLLQSIIDNSSAVIFVKDLEGRYLLVNRRYEALFHLSNAAIVGKSDADIFPRDIAARLREADRQALAAGQAQEFEEEVPQDDGLHTYIAIKCPLRDAGGKPYAVCGIATDITERKAAEADRRARLAAEAASRAKSEFLSAMSHELRTPLNAILGYAQLLAGDPGLTPRQGAGLETIARSGRHLMALIDDVLDLAKIEAGRFELQPAPLETAGFLQGVADIIRVRAEEKSLAFALHLSPQPPAVVADEKRLRQVLLNLLSNAVKFTDRGQVSLAAEVLTGDGPGVRLRFAVADSGIGIPAAQRETIFQPFEQAGEAHRRAAGTGLGLAISRRLVRQMGGDIAVESETGVGSRFWFELEFPLAAVPLAAAPLPPSPEAPPAPPPVEALEALHRLALTGNMRSIRQWAADLAASEAAWRPFAERVDRLARGFQSKAILALVQEHLAGRKP